MNKIPNDETVQNGEGREQNSKTTQKQRKTFTSNERGRFVQLKILGQGECFGEEEILKKRGVEYHRIYRVVCNSESGTLYAVPKKSLQRLLPHHPAILQAMISQTQNKEQARQIRLNQLAKINQLNEDSEIIAGQIRTQNNTIPVQDPFQPNLLLNFNKLKQGENNQLSKTVKLVKNCDLVENVFREDDHNYLIFSSQIPSNSFLPKNPKLRKENSIYQQEGQINDKNNLQIEEIDKNKYLKILENQNVDISEHETRSTLLYDEGLNKKKPTSNQKSVSTFETEYLKDFSQRFNIPSSQLRSRSNIVSRQKSPSEIENLSDSYLSKRKGQNFLIKANHQKNLLRQNSKSIFQNSINQQDSSSIRGSPMSINAPFFKEGITFSDLGFTPKNQKSSYMSFYQNSNQNSPNCSTNQINTDVDVVKVPFLQLDEKKQTNNNNTKMSVISEIKNKVEEKKNKIEHKTGVINSYLNLNLTPRNTKSPKTVFKFLNAEYNSLQNKNKSRLAIENKALHTLLKQTSLQTVNLQTQKIEQYDIFRKQAHSSHSQKHSYLQMNHFNQTLDQRQQYKQISHSEGRTRTRINSEVAAFSDTANTQISLSNAITKLISTSIINQPFNQSENNKSNNNNNNNKSLYDNNRIKQSSSNSSKRFVQHNNNNALLKTAAEQLFKQKLPSTVRIKRFQLSSTFKNQDNQSQPIGLNLVQSLSGSKYKLFSRQASPATK